MSAEQRQLVFIILDRIKVQVNKFVKDLPSKMQKRLAIFCLASAVDLLLIFPFYCVFTGYECYQSVTTLLKMFPKEEEHQKRNQLLQRLLKFYLLDIVLPFSVIGLLYISLHNVDSGFYNQTYIVQARSSFLFFVSFILMSSFLSVGSGDGFSFEFAWFLNDQHLHALGLGKIKQHLKKDDELQFYLKSKEFSFTDLANQQNQQNQSQAPQTESKGNQLNEQVQEYKLLQFEKTVKKISRNNGYELNLFFFNTFGCEHQPSLPQNRHTISLQANRQTLSKLGFQGFKTGIKDLLFEKYKAVDANQSKEEINFPFVILVLALKIFLPYFYIMVKSLAPFELFPFMCIALFYSYMVINLYQIFNNEDLKRRIFFNKEMTEIMNFQLEDADEPEEQPKQSEANARKSQNKSNLEKQEHTIEMRPINQNKAFINHEDDFHDKIDITCPVSVETWDTARRIAFQLGQDKTEQFEVSYIFLGIYGFFLLIILGSIFAEITVLFGPKSDFYNPVIVMHLGIDFLLITTILLYRIFYGDQLNKTISNQTEVMQYIQRSLDVLKTLQGFYFHPDLRNRVKSAKFYLKIVDELNKKISDSRMPRADNGINLQDSVNLKKEKIAVEQKLKLQTMEGSIKKVAKQLSKDENTSRILFLGVLDMNFEAAQQTLILILFTIGPSVLNKIHQIFK